MKAVILNGSPRKKGSTATALRAIHDELATEAEVEWFDAYDLKLKPCMGCMKCRPDGECVLPADDAQRVRAAVSSSDILVVGTPAYWGNMTAPLKMLFDRNVTLFESFDGGWPKPKQKGKRAAIVVSSGSPMPWSMLPTQGGGAIRSVRTILRSGGYSIKGTMRLAAVKPEEVNGPRQTAQAAAIARKLLALAIIDPTHSA